MTSVKKIINKQFKDKVMSSEKIKKEMKVEMNHIKKPNIKNYSIGIERLKKKKLTDFELKLLINSSSGILLYECRNQLFTNFDGYIPIELFWPETIREYLNIDEERNENGKEWDGHEGEGVRVLNRKRWCNNPDVQRLLEKMEGLSKEEVFVLYSEVSDCWDETQTYDNLTANLQVVGSEES